MNIDEDRTLIQTEEERKELERKLLGEHSDDSDQDDTTAQDRTENPTS